jgi:hypothetical protein
MAEIKSAIEIAMERTQTLRLSSEEKERIQEEELRSKTHGLVNRFLEVDLHFREVEKELAKYSPEQRSQVEKIMLADFGARLDLDRNNELIFQGIEILAPDKGKMLLQGKELIKEYLTQKEKEHQKAEKILRNKLETMGISGPAVLPKVEETREWVDALSALRALYAEKLWKLKGELQK